MIRTPLRRQRKVKDSEKGVAVKVFSDGREVCTKSLAGRDEYRERTWLAARRQHDKCAICMETFELRDPTFDHQAGRTAGRKDERLLMEDGVTWRNAALCSHCNIAKGSRKFHWTESNTRYVEVERNR